MVTAPGVLSHAATSKKCRARDMVVVGRSPRGVCGSVADEQPRNASDVHSLMQTFGAGVGNRGRIGLVWPNFVSGPNGVPGKPWTNIMAYNQVGGEMVVSNVTFVNFGLGCGLLG